MTTENTFSLLGRAEGTHPNDGYAEPSWELDLSGGNRKNLAETLTDFFKQSSTPYVVAVHGEWGIGKTFFLKAWKNWLLQQPLQPKNAEQNSQSEEKNNEIGLPCFYFNAWEVDYSEDALLAFSYSIIKQIEEQRDNKASCISKISESIFNWTTEALKKAPATMGSLTTIGIKAGLRWLKIDPNEVVDAFVQDTTDAIANKIQATFEKTQDARQAVKDNIKEFAKACYDETGSPITIMVDELDRCKPSFAVELLENIKHLFSVPHVIFILALEENQLSNCISNVYGLDTVGAKRYLGRFIDMQVRLPEIDIEAYVNSYATTCNFLKDQVGITRFSVFNNSKEIYFTVGQYLTAIFSQLNLSLRDIHQVLSRLAIVNTTGQNNLYLILCGKALARLQLGDTLDNIVNLGDMPDHIKCNRNAKYPQLTEALEQVEDWIVHNYNRDNLNDSRYHNKLLIEVLEVDYNQLLYTPKNTKTTNDIYYKNVFLNYQACIKRDLSTVSGIDFSL